MDNGEVIRRERKRHNLSLREVALLTGISAMHLSRIERGVNRLTDHVASKVFPVLGIGCESINEPVISALVKNEELLSLVKVLILKWKQGDIDSESLRSFLLSTKRSKQGNLELIKC